MSRLRFESLVACPFSDVVDYAENYFHEHAPGVLRVRLRLGPLQFVLKRAITTGIMVCPDLTDPARRHDALELWIHPLGALPFPQLSLLLTARPYMPPGTRVVLDLTYRPPFGLIGFLLDALVGRHVAKSTGRALLNDLCAHLTARSGEPNPALLVE